MVRQRYVKQLMRNSTRKCADDPRAYGQPESSFTRDGLLVSFSGPKTKPSPRLVALARNVAKSETQTRSIHLPALKPGTRKLEPQSNWPSLTRKVTKLSKLDRSPTHARLPAPPQNQEPIHPHDTTPHHNEPNLQLHPSTFDPSTWLQQYLSPRQRSSPLRLQ